MSLLTQSNQWKIVKEYERLILVNHPAVNCDEKSYDHEKGISCLHTAIRNEK